MTSLNHRTSSTNLLAGEPLHKRDLAWVYRLSLFAVIAGVAVWMTSIWVLHQVKLTIAELNRAHLQTVLHSETMMIDTWFRDLNDVATAAASDASVRTPAASLLEPTDLLSPVARDATTEVVRATLHPLLEAEGIESFLLVAADGRIVACDSNTSLSSATLSNAEAALVQTALQGGTVIGSPADAQTQQGTMAAASPILDSQGRAVGTLLLRIPISRFSDIFRVGHAGNSGETYAFDSDGRLLTFSRFADDLRRWGILPANADSATLHLILRDPGFDLSKPHDPLDLLDAPFTWAVQQAIIGEPGEQLEGYRDYRGHLVVGAWTWLDTWRVGLVTELDYVEAYRPLHVLRRVVLIVLVLMGAMALFGFGALAWSEIARKRYDMALRTNESIGSYVLGERIGSGAMGDVYRATHRLLRRPAAVKIIRDADAPLGTQLRFEREVQLTAELHHPNTIAVYDYGRRDDGLLYYVMEYLEGLDLDAMVQRYGPQPQARVVHFLLQVCGSVAEAHTRRFVHRDLKPPNIFVCHWAGVSDLVKVLDFGLVRDARVDETLNEDSTALLGTPSYMAPELFESAAHATARSDVYALGAIAWFLVTGQRVFSESSIPALLLAHREEEPGRPSERLGAPVDEVLEQLIVDCLRKDPDARPSDADAMLRRLMTSPLVGQWTRDHAVAWWKAPHAMDRAAVPEHGALREPPVESRS